MGDTEVVLSSLGYLVVVTTLLALAGFGESNVFELPSNPYTITAASQNTTTGTVDTVLCAAGVLAGTITGGAAGALLGFGVGGIAGAALGGTFLGAFLGCDKVQDTVIFIIGLGEIILNFFGFLFQLLIFQIPEIPSWLNAIIILPPGIALAFVALKTIRGAGG